jgi:hypothetical protein
MSRQVEARDYQSRQVAALKREFVARRRRQAISTVPVGLLGLVLALGGWDSLGLGAQSLTVAVGGGVRGLFAFSLANWRCPACSAYLGQRLNPLRCRACGARLRD